MSNNVTDVFQGVSADCSTNVGGINVGGGNTDAVVVGVVCVCIGVAVMDAEEVLLYDCCAGWLVSVTGVDVSGVAG